MSQEAVTHSPSDIKSQTNRIITPIYRDAKEFKALPVPRSEIGGSSQDIQYCEELKTGNRWIVKCSYNAMATLEALADLSQQLGKPLKPYFEEYKEWLGLACYQLFGVATSEIALGNFLPAKTATQDRLEGLNYDTPCLHVMSKFMPGFQEYDKGIGVDFLARYRQWAQTKEGYFQFRIQETEREVPLKGFGAVLAVACFIYDLDCLGNSLRNIGFRIQKDGSGEYAETIKIDPGFAFSFLEEESPHDPRDRTVQHKTIRQGDDLALICFAELTRPDQIEFAQTARKIFQAPTAMFKTLIDQVVMPNGFTQTQADKLLVGLLDRRSSLLNAYKFEVSKQLESEDREAQGVLLNRFLTRRATLSTVTRKVLPDEKCNTNKEIEDKSGKVLTASSSSVSSAAWTPNLDIDGEDSVDEKKQGKVTKFFGTSLSFIVESDVLMEQFIAQGKAIRLRMHLEREIIKGAKPDEKSRCRVFQSPVVTADFIGRESILETIAKQLQAAHGNVITQVINGMGGVGKTQIAAKFVKLASEGQSCGGVHLNYQTVIWLHAGAELDLQFIALAEAWCKRTSLKWEEAVKEVYRYLEGKRALLVFDNALNKKNIVSFLPPPKSVLKSGIMTVFSPSSNNSPHVLITSSTHDWVGMPTLSVDGFSKEEAIAYVRRYLPTTPEEEIHVLLKTVSTLPLALSQAVAYIVEGHSTVQNYPKKFASHQLKPRGVMVLDNDAHALLRTLLLPFYRLKRQNHLISPILYACAYLAPKNIPVVWLETAFSGPETLNGGGMLGRFPLDEVRVALTILQDNILLLSKKPGLLEIPNLLQQLIREDLRNTNKEQNQIGLVLNWLVAANPCEGGNHVTDKAWEAFLPHLEAIIEHCVNSNKVSVNLGTALKQAGDIYLYLLDQPDKSRVAYEQAFDIREMYHGQDHHFLVSILINLGNVYIALDNLPKAKEHLERALKMAESFDGQDYAVAMILTNLGIVHGDLGDISKKRDYLECALTIKKSYFGSDHPEVAKTLMNLAIAYYELKESASALVTAQRAYQILLFHPKYGAKHPTTREGLEILQSQCGFSLKDLRDEVFIEEEQEKQEEKEKIEKKASTSPVSAQLLAQQGLARIGVQEAKNRMGQSVLKLHAAISGQCMLDCESEPYSVITAEVVKIIADGKADFRQLYETLVKYGIAAKLGGFIQTYVTQHPELYNLSSYPDFAHCIVNALLDGNLDELYICTGLPKPHSQQNLALGSSEQCCFLM